MVLLSHPWLPAFVLGKLVVAKWQLAECRKQKGKGRKHLPVEVAALRGPGTVTGTE